MYCKENVAAALCRFSLFFSLGFQDHAAPLRRTLCFLRELSNNFLLQDTSFRFNIGEVFVSYTIISSCVLSAASIFETYKFNRFGVLVEAYLALDLFRNMLCKIQRSRCHKKKHCKQIMNFRVIRNSYMPITIF